MLEKGFVKLPRCIITRKWFGDKNTLQLYVALLLKAAFRESEFEGVRLKPGQLITSVAKLAEATSLSVQQTKTALKHLKETNDIAIQTTSKFSIITLNFDSDEQSDNKPVNRLANKQGNKQNNNISRREKEEGIEESIKEGGEEGGASPASPPPVGDSFSSVSDEALDLTGFKERLIKEYGIDLVERYEAKFTAWREAKNASNVPMYPTIAKWLAMDAAQAPKPQAAAAKAAELKAPPSKRSFDTDRLRAAVLAGYKKM